jgi:hypothetical protein
MLRKTLVILVLVAGLLNMIGRPQTVKAGGEKWDAWFYDSSNMQLILHRPGGQFSDPITLPSTYGLGAGVPGSVTLSNNWNAIAYTQSNINGPDYRAALSLIDRNTLGLMFSHPMPGGMVLGNPAFSNDNTAIAVGYSKVDDQNTPAWTIDVLGLPGGQAVAALKSSDPMAADLPQHYATTPVIESLRGKKLMFMLIQGMADGPTNAPSYIWDFGANTVTPLENSGAGSADLYAPTGEIVYSGLDTRFPVCATCSVMGTLNTLSFYSPTTNKVTPFFTTPDDSLGFPKFIQNGERIVVAMTQTVAGNEKTRYAILERSGAVVGYLPDSAAPSRIIGTQDGFLYLDGMGQDQPISLVEVVTRTGIQQSLDWTAPHSGPLNMLDTPGNMTGTGPFLPWNTGLTSTGSASTGSVTPTAAGCPPTRLTVGGMGQVTPGAANNLRNAPQTGAIVGSIPPGGVFMVLEGPICNPSGVLWWKVKFNGLVGYTAEGQGSTYFVTPYTGATPSISISPTPHTSTFGIVGVTAAVAPASSTTCPTTFAFHGQVVVNVPGQVMYRWERSDGAVGPTLGITYPDGVTTVDVETTWALSAAGNGWERIHVLSPNDIFSNQANFTLTCGAPSSTVTHVAASVASPGGATCPIRYNFTGTLTTNGPTTVTYKWERSDGATAPVQTISFGAAGTQTVTTDWTLGAAGFSYNGWERLHILTPNDVTSNQANFVLTCP